MPQKKINKVYIIGAGFAGRQLGEEIAKKNVLGALLGYLDDKAELAGIEINNVKVHCPIDSILALQKEKPADEAIIAIPRADNKTLARIYGLLTRAGIPRIRFLPSLSQIVDGAAHLIQTRSLEAEDLLKREQVVIPLKKSLQYLRGRRVLITGAGGSIGSELSRQLLSGGAERLYLFDNGENSLFEIDRELRLLQEEGVGEKAAIVPVLGDLRDRDYTSFILSRLKADVIFHCAAYKHVPMLEYNPLEAVTNNVFGTKNIVEAAAEAGASRFVLISSDKAVEPSSIYGASKALGEEIVLSQRASQTQFMVVRFGNVLGSRGSIVPLFQKQILKGGPVTITHPGMTRFFMTIPEAASLVLMTGGMGEGGSLYILEMGEPLRILDLAREMIAFYGFEPGQEIKIQYIGLRPGEKLTESLLAPDETPERTSQRGISRLRKNPRLGEGLGELLKNLEGVCRFDPERPQDYRNRIRVREYLAPFYPHLRMNQDEPEY
ncbi:MAG: polysaccharide biosynthesis protein [Spirochaetales bacterium]|jgi:FlaA1/EpsC-like NDP-sugar epimerase|nr:polysaccharide biosynthesis protein [Spirochaetales bacterium]